MKHEMITRNEEQGVSIIGKLGNFMQSLMENHDDKEAEKLEIVTRSLGQDIGEASSGFEMDYKEQLDKEGYVTERHFHLEKKSSVIREDVR